MTALQERPEMTNLQTFLDIPAFANFGLYDLGGSVPIPLSEIPVEGNGAVDLFFVGEHEKGQMFVFRPRNPDDITVHFEHRFKHSPLTSRRNTSNLDRIPLISEDLKTRDETIVDMEEYMRRLSNGMMTKAHRDTQEFLRDYWDIFSRRIDPSLETLCLPKCHLEVDFKGKNVNGEEALLPVDAFAITHGATGVMIEVASRRIDDNDGNDKKKEERRKKKYEFVERNLDLSINQYGQDLEIIAACVFYEVLEDNTLYLSLRYPQEVLSTNESFT